MKQLTLNISENNFNTFLEFIKTIDYVEVPEPDEKPLKELQATLRVAKD